MATMVFCLFVKSGLQRSSNLVGTTPGKLSCKLLDLLRICVCCDRGLFEKDKLVFSFMLCVEVLKLSDQVLPDDWNYFIRGATGTEINFPPKPDIQWLQQWVWVEACKLDFVLPAFRGLKDDVLTTPCWVHFGDNNMVSIV